MTLLSRCPARVLGILVLAAVPTAPRAADTAAAPAVSAPRVTVVKAVTTEVVANVIVSGTLVARDEVLVSPEIDNLAVVDLLGEEGDAVARGQVLARLSRSKLDVELAQNAASLARTDAAIAQAKAQIAEADAAKAQADSALARVESLQGSGSATAAQYDQALANARAAAARLDAARQGLALATAERQLTLAQQREIELNVRRTEVRAPSAGVISRRTAKVGAVARMANDPLFRIIADGAVELDAEVPESELARIASGQAVSVVPAGAANPLSGKVRLIAPEVDRQTRLGHVRITLPDEARVFIGGFARGAVETGRHTGVTLPVQAVTFTRDGPVAQVVRDGQVETRRVTLGLVGGGRAEIVRGVGEGEVVVARAGTFLRDGDAVNAVPLADAEAAER